MSMRSRALKLSPRLLLMLTIMHSNSLLSKDLQMSQD